MAVAIVVTCAECGTEYEVERERLIAADWMDCPRCAPKPPADEAPAAESPGTPETLR